MEVKNVLLNELKHASLIFFFSIKLFVILENVSFNIFFKGAKINDVLSFSDNIRLNWL